MKKKLEQLEKLSALLDPTPGRRRKMTEQTIDFAESFLVKLPDLNAFVSDKGSSNELDPVFGEEAGDLTALLKTLDTAVVTEGINPASGGHLGYIPGGGIYPSALGDFLADVTNRYSGVSYASPGAARMELQLVQWMTRLVGYPETSGGDLTSGGSIANLTAIIAARETMGSAPGILLPVAFT